MAFVPVYILILGFTIVVDYFAGIFIENAAGKKRKFFLVCSLVANIGILCVFKYYNFINENFSFLLHGFGLTNPIPYLSILLPIGLSFHTFQAMSYTIEVYRGHQKTERHFGIYALYVMFYPQLVAGPIERPQNLLHQFRQQYDFDSDRVFEGLKIMIWGLFKKLVIADRLGIYVSGAYNNVPEQNGMTLLLATIFFSFQVYCDFSGYSDIAIGAAKVMGFDLMTNFRRPILAKSTGEFWQRWHISLSTWFKDYLYFPMGGSRVSVPRWYMNLMVVFLISGLWHGANWTYIIWGGINGFYLVFAIVTQKYRDRFNQFTGIVKRPRLHLFFQISITFLLITFSRIFFRSRNISDAVQVIKKIFTFKGSIFNDGTAIIIYCFFAIFFLLSVELKKEFYRGSFTLSRHKNFWVRNSYYSFLIILIILLGVFDGGQFIYFQF
ncbi:MBOAT family O-acyltransferase [Ferruginibacter paludis]|uniref:MBOAT family O-acyltransferase n=1 Tax=Ferruginibacter paludis TaxID=1310417 RepID=UPI0025B5669C|nr:MBOAT family O-acyltransferase [Ferruginibacter paludis]MDN3657621.1 MBOAT family O-acyltransferase [Ferruginibacter paludis]